MAHGQTRENVVREVRRCLCHASRVARRADSTAFAREGDKIVVSAVVTTGAGKAMRKDAAFQIFAKRQADIDLWCVVLTLAVELACAGQLKPGLEILGDGFVEQGSLGMTWVVEFGFGR